MSITPAAILGRHARAIRILTCLQSGPGFNAEELARHLGVSRRTIYRDLNLIREAGIPICFDERHAAYRLERDSHQHLLPTLEPSDLIQLSLAAHGSLLKASPEFDVESRRAMTKMLCLFPVDVRNRVTRMLSGCRVQIPDIQIEDREWGMGELILSAIGDQTCLRARIDDERGDRRTRIEPYRLDIALNGMQLTGRSSFDAARICAQLSNVRELELTEIPFQAPRAARFLSVDERPTEAAI